MLLLLLPLLPHLARAHATATTTATTTATSIASLLPGTTACTTMTTVLMMTTVIKYDGDDDDDSDDYGDGEATTTPTTMATTTTQVPSTALYHDHYSLLVLPLLLLPRLFSLKYRSFAPEGVCFSSSCQGWMRKTLPRCVSLQGCSFRSPF